MNRKPRCQRMMSALQEIRELRELREFDEFRTSRDEHRNQLRHRKTNFELLVKPLISHLFNSFHVNHLVSKIGFVFTRIGFSLPFTRIEDPGSGMGTGNLGRRIQDHSLPNHIKCPKIMLIQTKSTATPQTKSTATPQNETFLLTKLTIFGKMDM